MATREKLILTGLFLSKFDKVGLDVLGFESFSEAFNAIGYALGSRPASVKNYRDEFDPLFPNPRRGWHQRATRRNCLEVFERYRDLDLTSFSYLIGSFFQASQATHRQDATVSQSGEGESSFAQRLITGLAAEQYFESIHNTLDEFRGLSLENTTRFGCGYDFRLWNEAAKDDFLAVEVKGLRDKGGSLSMTPKEYEVAMLMQNRFLLFVVRNFREQPYHDIFANPLSGALSFKKVERVTVQWPGGQESEITWYRGICDD